MNKNNQIKWSTLATGLGIAALVLGGSLSAFADSKGLGLGLGLKAQVNAEDKHEDKKATPSPRASVAIDSKGSVHLTDAKVTAVSGNTVSVLTTWGTMTMPWTVQVDSSTNISHSGSVFTLASVMMGDTVSVQGTLTSTSPFTVQAKTFTDPKMQNVKRSPFFGKVTAIATSTQSFVVATDTNGTQTVFVSAATQITKEGVVVATLANLQVGDQVSVGGLWNQVQSTIQAERVKIFLNPQIKQTTFAGTLLSVASTTAPTQIVIIASGNGSAHENVVVNADTSILDRNWAKTTLASFATNDKIRVYGAAEGATITATVIRNVSIPR